MTRTLRAWAAAAVLAPVLAAGAVPAAAQGYSDSFTFLKAVRERDGDTVQTLAASGSVVVNSRDRSSGDTALHIVARDRDAVWIAFLVGRGARVDSQNNGGLTPLAVAAQVGWAEGAEALLARGASPDLANRAGETPLSFAVRNRDLATVRALVAGGANPRRADNAGLTPLDHATRDGRSAAMIKLLEQGAARRAIGPGR